MSLSLSCNGNYLVNCLTQDHLLQAIFSQKEGTLRGQKFKLGWCSLEGLMLKLKLQYFGHLMRKVDLKCKIQKTKIMASSPITSWEMGK